MIQIKLTSLTDFHTIVCPLDEQETIITFLRQDDTIKIYTSDNTILTVLRKKFVSNPKDWTGIRIDNYSGETTGYEFTVPKSFIRFATFKREFSEEQRSAMRERLKMVKILKKEKEEDETDE